RQQKGRGEDAWSEPPRALPEARTSRSVRHDHAPPRERGDGRGINKGKGTRPMVAPKNSPPAIQDEARANSVLIVDDEHGVRNLMARWLETGGYDVTTAASAEEALGQF